MAAQQNFSNLATLSFLMFLAISMETSTSSQDILPHICDAVKCPPMVDIQCPDDSNMRETLRPLALLHTVTAATPTTEVAYNTSKISEDLYLQCCVAKKCICRTCYIPDCEKEYEVVVELVPESIETPGHCCGDYSCEKEPNCTEVRDTESYWLTNCQRCKCYSGERICHQSCDEDLKKETAKCTSENLNTFFEHGDVWKDGCSECECVHGEPKCVLPFCRSVNCPLHRQVFTKDSCCPLCWPKGVPMPHGDEEYDEQNADGNDVKDEFHAAGSIYEDRAILAPLAPVHPTNEYGEREIYTLPNIQFDNVTNTAAPTTSTEAVTAPTTTSTSTSTTTSTTTTSTTSTNTAAPTTTAGAKPSALPVTEETPKVPPQLPCQRHEAPATYQVYPEVVEVVHQTPQSNVLYIIIGVLALGVFILGAWNVQLRAKQRSYRPVSNFDDNFNKMSSNIKKTNEYV